MKTAIWWLRRDLRLADNQALAAALANADQVIPLFILDSTLLRSSFVGGKRTAFLIEGLHRIDEALRKRGSRLIVRSGDPRSVLAALCSEGVATAIYAETDHSPYARRRDEKIRQLLPLVLVGSTAVHAPGSVLKPDDTPYTVYTPFSKRWKSLAGSRWESLVPEPEYIPTHAQVHSEPLPEITALALKLSFRAGENEARRRFRAFTDGLEGKIGSYRDGRDQLAQEGTSLLSPYLRFGMLSPREAAQAPLEAMQRLQTGQARNSAEMWLNELVWRDFYIHILHHFPWVREKSFRLDGIHWENDPEKFATWREGRTGYPLVDAAMRQLAETGWMHNRARMISASFLTKDLLIDWRWGERWFMQQLLDGDPAANNGGWQWTAGTGTDAAPYFRVFNPKAQGIKFDPRGEYIRRWLPELVNVPEEYIHEPASMPANIQAKSGCVIGKHYPYPMIDHAWARQRAIAVYSQARSLSSY